MTSPKKTYYRIREVAGMLNIPTKFLRMAQINNPAGE